MEKKLINNLIRLITLIFICFYSIGVQSQTIPYFRLVTNYFSDGGSCECGWSRANAICGMRNQLSSSIQQDIKYITGCFGGNICFKNNSALADNTYRSFYGSHVGDCKNSDILIVKKKHHMNDNDSWWIQSTHSPGTPIHTGKDEGNGICVDELGFVYVVGTFWGSIIFKTGDANTSGFYPPTCLPISSAGGSDIFLVKFKPTGEYDRHIRIGNAFNEEGKGITIDKTHQFIYITGYETTPTGKRAFISKHNTGNLLQVKKAALSYNGTNVSSIGKSICVKGSFVAITGDIEGQTDPSKRFKFGTTYLPTFLTTGNNHNSALVLVCNTSLSAPKANFSNDQVTQHSKANGNSISALSDFKLDENSIIDGHFYVTGSFSDKIKFYNYATSLTSANNSSGFKSNDIFVAKFDFTGNCMGLINVGGNGEDIGRGISVGLYVNETSVFVTGSYSTDGYLPGLANDPYSLYGDQDGFVLKLNSDLEIRDFVNFGGYKASGNAIFTNYICGFGDGWSTHSHIAGYFEQTCKFPCWKNLICPQDVNPVINPTIGHILDFSLRRDFYDYVCH